MRYSFQCALGTAGLMLLMLCNVVEGQSVTKDTLLDSLSNSNTRREAVAFVKQADTTYLPLLLSWAEHPPEVQRASQLYVGLADAFGELRAPQAIPFLIRNINIERSQVRFTSTWTKAPAAVEARLPAVSALIKIGAPAVKAIYDQWWRMAGDDRLAGLYVVARAGEGQEARDFLNSASARIDFERQWAEEASRYFETRR